jgi:alpha-L-fucosidase
MNVNGEAIFGTRPWKTFGEGPTKITTGMFNEDQVSFTPQDFRFTTKDRILYVFMMGWPKSRIAVIKSLAAGSDFVDGERITDIELLGSSDTVPWNQDDDGLKITLPEKAAAPFAVTFKMLGAIKK